MYLEVIFILWALFKNFLGNINLAYSSLFRSMTVSYYLKKKTSEIYIGIYVNTIGKFKNPTVLVL